MAPSPGRPRAALCFYTLINRVKKAALLWQQNLLCIVCVCVREFGVQLQGVFIDSGDGSPAVSTTIGIRACTRRA